MTKSPTDTELNIIKISREYSNWFKKAQTYEEAIRLEEALANDIRTLIATQTTQATQAFERGALTILKNIKSYGSYGKDSAYLNEPFIVVPVADIDEIEASLTKTAGEGQEHE